MIETHPDSSTKYRIKNRKLLNIKGKEYTVRIRNEVINAYGGKCVCCGESTVEFLTIDHINGNGHKHKILTGKGRSFYAWLKRNNWPTDNYQVLCWNCNCAKGRYKTCPHQSSNSNE